MIYQNQKRHQASALKKQIYTTYQLDAACHLGVQGTQKLCKNTCSEARIDRCDKLDPCAARAKNKIRHNDRRKGLRKKNPADCAKRRHWDIIIVHDHHHHPSSFAIIIIHDYHSWCVCARVCMYVFVLTRDKCKLSASPQTVETKTRLSPTTITSQCPRLNTKLSCTTQSRR